MEVQNPMRPHPLNLLRRKIHIGNIHRASRRPPIHKPHQLLRRIHTDRFLRLDRRSTNMWSQNHILRALHHIHKPLTPLRRLLRKDIHRRPRDLSRINRLAQRLKIYRRPARVINQIRPLLHLPDPRPIHHPLRRLRLRDMQRHHISNRQQLIERPRLSRVPERELAVAVKEHHPHPHRLREHTHLRTDMPVPHNPKRSTTHLVRPIRALVPLPLVQQRRPMRHATMQRDDLADRQLRDRPRVTKRRVKHRNPHRRCNIQINLIRPRTKTPDRKQPLALLQDLPSQLRLRPNPDDMRPTDRVDQLRALQRTAHRRYTEPLALDQRRARRMRPLQQHHLDFVLRKRSLLIATLHNITHGITSSTCSPSPFIASSIPAPSECNETIPIAIAPPSTAVKINR